MSVRVYGTNGYIEHMSPDESSECIGCVLVNIEGDECTLVCNECGVELGSGGLSEAPVATRAGGKARVGGEDDDEE